MKRTLCAVALLVVCSAVPAAAQKIGLGVGTLVPQGDLADGAKSGFSAIASFEMGGRIALRAEALWANSSLNGAIITAPDGTPVPSGANVSGDVKVIGGLASLVLHLGVGPIQPYILAGAGYYNRSGSQNAPSAAAEFQHLSLNASKLGYHAGAGIKVTLLGISVFGEARYHSVNTDDAKTNFIPIIVGLRL
jgi:opacity protein-like surface antigen